VKLSLRPTRGGLVPAFFRRAKAAVGHWEADLLAGGFGGGACCSRAGLWRRQCFPSDVFGLYFLLVVLCILLFLGTIAYVWLKFY
jgi:hypothetical protein